MVLQFKRHNKLTQVFMFIADNWLTRNVNIADHVDV